MKKTILSLAIAAISLAASAFEGPTMGWSSWNTYRVHISDSLIMRQADAMVANGLDSVGYRFINIDDGYFGGRDADGNLLFHPIRFPSGLRPVVDHIHSLGLKAGIYSDAGHNTCGNYYDNDSIAQGVGFYEHDLADARLLFADLGFDFIKVDFCGGDAPQNSERLALDPRTRYTEIRHAIDSVGRPDVRLNVCRWNYPGTWVSDLASSWRMSHDISDNWPSVRGIIDENLYLSAYARNGHFNDMDMLEVGRSLSDVEDRTHFAIWCIMSSPLLIGCDMTTLRPATLDLLTNTELIALNQDPLALQAYVADHSGDTYILVKDIIQRDSTTRAVALYNPTDTAVTMTLRFADVDLAGPVAVRDLFTHTDLGSFTDSLTRLLPPHATEIFRLDASRRLPRLIYEAETAFLTAYQEIADPIAAGTARYIADPAAHGRMAVTAAGNSPHNDIIWPDITLPTTDTTVDTTVNTPVTIRWRADTPTKMTIQANGTDITTLDLPASPTYTDLTLTIPLRRTSRSTTPISTPISTPNTIRLYSPSTPLPTIDRLTLHP